MGRVMLTSATAALCSPSGTGRQQGSILPPPFQHSTFQFFCCQTPSQHGGVSNYHSTGSFVPTQKGIRLIPPQAVGKQLKEGNEWQGKN